MGHDSAVYNAGFQVGRWVARHLGWFWLLLTPLIAWAVRLPFRRVASYNFYEVLTLMLFLTGEVFLLRTLLLPLQLWLTPDPAGHPWYSYPCLAYWLWGIWQLYEQALPRPWPRLGRALLSLLMASLLSATAAVGLITVVALTAKFYPVARGR